MIDRDGLWTKSCLCFRFEERRPADFAHSLWDRGVHELLTTVSGRLVTPVDDGFVHAVCTGHQRKVHLGIVDQTVVPPRLEHAVQIVVSEGYAKVFGALIPR